MHERFQIGCRIGWLDVGRNYPAAEVDQACDDLQDQRQDNGCQVTMRTAHNSVNKPLSGQIIAA